MSPEMIQGNSHDKKCDMWSIGVILYAMLVGEPLFTHDSDAKCERQILDAAYLRRTLTRVRGVSIEGRDMMAQMLKREPGERIGAKE